MLALISGAGMHSAARVLHVRITCNFPRRLRIILHASCPPAEEYNRLGRRIHFELAAVADMRKLSRVTARNSSVPLAQRARD
jgi:hypothetical protein